MTELGEVVNQMMKEAFQVLWMSTLLLQWKICWIKVGDGTVDWKVVVRNFYPDLDESVKAKQRKISRSKLEAEVLM